MSAAGAALTASFDLVMHQRKASDPGLSHCMGLGIDGVASFQTKVPPLDTGHRWRTKQQLRLDGQLSATGQPVAGSVDRAAGPRSCSGLFGPIAADRLSPR